MFCGALRPMQRALLKLGTHRSSGTLEDSHLALLDGGVEAPHEVLLDGVRGEGEGEGGGLWLTLLLHGILGAVRDQRPVKHLFIR